MNEPPFPQKYALNLAQEKFQQLYLSATLQEVISKYAISRKVYVYDGFPNNVFYHKMRHYIDKSTAL